VENGSIKLPFEHKRVVAWVLKLKPGDVYFFDRSFAD